MTELTYNPTKRLKTLYRRACPLFPMAVGLKEFAIDLQINGTGEQKKLVADWLDRKAPEVKRKDEPKNAVMAPPKTNGKKR